MPKIENDEQLGMFLLNQIQLEKELSQKAARVEFLKKAIKDYIGTTAPEDKKGNKSMLVTYHGRKIRASLTKSISADYVHDFLDRLKKAYPHLYNKVVDTVTYEEINQPALSTYIASGKISKKFMDSVIVKTERYSLRKEDVTGKILTDDTHTEEEEDDV